MSLEQTYSDSLLIKLAQNGDLNAFDKLLERYYHKINQIVGFYINEQANASDLVQEVLLKVYRYLRDFKEECEFTTWLYRIAQNTIKNYFRTISTRQDLETQFAVEKSSETYLSPEYELINNELGALVDLAIAKLSEDLRLCYGMHLFEGQTYEDIAHKMHCPIGTVRSRIFRARKQVMDFIAPSLN